MSKKNVIVAIMAVFFVSLTATSYGEDKKDEVRTVEWYMAPENEAAYEAKLEECKNNPGELQNTPNCINAIKAKNKKFYEWKD